MKIKSASIYLIKSGYVNPVIVEIVSDEGVTGIGEAAIAYGLGSTAAAGMIKDIAERLLIGRDPFRIEEIWSEMYDMSFWAKGGGAITFAGMSAIEQALWDLKGKAVNLPVYEFLGGKIFDDVPVYANGWNYHCLGADEWAQAAARPIEDGYKALKCYPLATQDSFGRLKHVTRRSHDREFLELAYQRVKKLIEFAGPDVEIMLDLSGGLTTDETIRLCKRYEDLGIRWLEEPCDAFDIGALKRVADSTNMSIAAGERLYTRAGFRAVMEPQIVDIVQPDIGNTGGIMETKKIGAMAEAYNLRVAPHNCASTLCTAGTLQVSVTLANFMTLEIYPYFSDATNYVPVLENPPEARIRNGRLTVLEEPGLGAILAKRNVAPFLWAHVTA
ncbi:mandelate racemase/muconate lactonizing enzyme family protein [Paraburkholderia nemoris]|uniref:mandelate racemase/muconate lactonizing enzyme family protein n=1 Tax=Paraburkholderia nemoris TaxID=2793076 RepID=UPI0038BBE753